MKKSEITVSMPMTTYEELSLYKDKFYKLLDEIRKELNKDKKTKK